MHLSARKALAALLLCTFAIACGGGDTSDDSTDTAAATDTATSTGTAVAPPAATTPEQTTEASISVEDIDRWKRGMNAEADAVKQAGEKLKAAKTSQDTLEAMFAANETSTRAVGARAAGLAEDRYGFIRTSLSVLVANMAPVESDFDVSKAPPEMVATLKAARDTALMRDAPKYNPAVVEALRPQAAALRKQDLELTAARLRAAGMVP